MTYSDQEFTAIMDAYGDMVLRICFVRLGRMADAQDAFQDVFLLLYTAKNKPRESYLKPWLIRTACNRCTSLLRKRRECAPLSGNELLPEGDVQNGAVREAVLSLPDTVRTAVYLYYFEELSPAQIASILQTSESNVRVRLHRGREALREQLKEEWQNESV